MNISALHYMCMRSDLDPTARKPDPVALSVRHFRGSGLIYNFNVITETNIHIISLTVELSGKLVQAFHPPPRSQDIQDSN